MPLHVFAGPTIDPASVLEERGDAVIHPPVSHGDLLRRGFCSDDTVLIVDGYYHQSGAVRHKEILQLLAEGVTVVGCSSMGALRAAELHPFGMIGTGEVFQMYADGIIDGDDEVAVAHTEDYRPLSLPLVNLRHALTMAGTEQSDEVLARAKALPYTSRTWAALGPAADDVRAYLAEHPEHADVKRADAVSALRGLDALRSQIQVAGWQDTGWRTPYLTAWRAEFGGLRYQQIYDPDFPGRWRRHVLVEEAALGPLTDRQRGYWLTPDELRDLDEAEAERRILIRSYGRPDPDHFPVTKDAPIAQAHELNERFAASAPGRHIVHLRPDVLADHLATLWKARDPAALLAAARDRGFPSLAEAIEAVRPYFLHHRAVT